MNPSVIENFWGLRKEEPYVNNRYIYININGSLLWFLIDHTDMTPLTDKEILMVETIEGNSVTTQFFDSKLIWAFGFTNER